MWEVSCRLNKDYNILTPSSSGYSSTSFSSCGAAQPGALRAQLFAGSGSHCFELQQLAPNSDLQLTRTSCCIGLYNIYIYISPASVSVASAPNSIRQQLRPSPDIFDRMHLLFTQVHFLFDSSAGSGVNILQIYVLKCPRFFPWRMQRRYDDRYKPDIERLKEKLLKVHLILDSDIEVFFYWTDFGIK